MIYLAYISICFLGMQFLNVILNLVFKQRIKNSRAENKELISVLIPARNEETNISSLLSDIHTSKNKNFEISFRLIFSMTISYCEKNDIALQKICSFL